MSNPNYLPLYALTRGKTLESLHHGAVSVVDAHGKLLAFYGNPKTVTFFRSSSKPFQAIPLIERGGQSRYDFSLKEIALICASHSGTDEHVSVVQGMQQKIGITENDLLCGVHYPLDEVTANQMRARGEKPTPNRHNCSGKHTGMLAFARMDGYQDLHYIHPEHPIQQDILKAVAQMCCLDPLEIALGTDGCSAPNFAVPLYNAAYAFARLSDPAAADGKSIVRSSACSKIVTAMYSNPHMVGGPGRFDTALMKTGSGRLVAKGGAEGFQGIGLMPGVLGPDSPAVGIAFKIADGDIRGKIRPAVGMEVLRQLGVLSPGDLDNLSEFGPTFSITNWRKMLVGEGYPTFSLQYEI